MTCAPGARALVVPAGAAPPGRQRRRRPRRRTAPPTRTPCPRPRRRAATLSGPGAASQGAPRSGPGPTRGRGSSIRGRRPTGDLAAQEPAVDEHADELLRVERIAPRARAEGPGSRPIYAWSRRTGVDRALSSADRGEREIVVEFLVPPPQPGARSESSGRAEHRRSIGRSVDQSTTCARNSNIAPSAQCRSSTTSTSGRVAATDSRYARQAAKDSSRSATAPGPRRRRRGEPAGPRSTLARRHPRPRRRPILELGRRLVRAVGLEDSCLRSRPRPGSAFPLERSGRPPRSRASCAAKVLDRR